MTGVCMEKEEELRNTQERQPCAGGRHGTDATTKQGTQNGQLAAPKSQERDVEQRFSL